MSDDTPQVIESQVDWLTLSVHSGKRTEQLRNIVEPWQLGEIERGCKATPFRLNGYIGWQAGRVRWGERESAGLVQLSGQLAEDHLGVLWPLRDTITRLDVAVTTRLPGSCAGIPYASYLEACAWHANHPKSARPECHVNADLGQTCMIGRRGSDYYLRIYDKERECIENADEEGATRYRNCVRAELECHDDAAALLAKQAVEAPDRAGWAQALLWDYQTAHGVCPPAPRGAARSVLPGFRRRSDLDSRRRWLTTQVRPAVGWLKAYMTASEIRQLLELDDGDNPVP